MFNKRKKARALQAQLLAHDRAQLEQKFDASIEEASQIKDPAEKVIALKKLEDSIDAQIWSESAAISQEVARKENRTLGVGTGATLTASFATLGVLSALVPPLMLISLPVAFVGMTGTGFATIKGRRSAREKLEAASKGHIERLAAKSALVSEMAEATVKDNVQQISDSPLYEDVFKLSGISKIFAVASAKHIATIKKEAAEQAKLSAAAAKKTQPRPKHDPHYRDIGQSGL